MVLLSMLIFVKKIMRFIIKVLIVALAVWVTAWLLPGITIDDFLTSLLVAFVLALLNVLVRPVLLFLSIPANILTLGLFTFVVNALIVLLAEYIIPGDRFVVDGFWWALLFSIIVSFISSLLESIVKPKENPQIRQ
jgi:putative membrane protein